MSGGGTEDYTLLSCDSCFNRNDVIGYLGDADLFTYIPNYLVLSIWSVGICCSTPHSGVECTPHSGVVATPHGGKWASYK